MYWEDLVQVGKTRGHVTRSEVETSITEAQTAMYEGMMLRAGMGGRAKWEARATAAAEDYGVVVQNDLENALATYGITIKEDA
jgi:hypothetical protein